MGGSNHLPIDYRRLHNTSTILEDRIALQHREIQSILLQNQQLAASHVALKQDLSQAQDQLRNLSAAAVTVKAERDDEVRQVYERSLKLEAQLRSIDAFRAELVQVKADVQKLTMHRHQLAAELLAINGDLSKERMELQQVPEIKAEINIMQQEIQRGRAAIEYDKKTQASNLEHRQTIEQNMVAIAREIEKLHAELANAEKRARVVTTAATAANPGPWNLQQS